MDIDRNVTPFIKHAAFPPPILGLTEAVIREYFEDPFVLI